MNKKSIIRFFCGILAAIVMFGIIPFGSLALENQELLRAELDRAKALGLPTDTLGKKTVTGQEMTQLLDHLVFATDKTKLEEWKTVIPNFRAGTEPILRYDAMVAIFLAAELLGEDQLNNDQWHDVHTAIGEKCWDSIHWNYDYFAGYDTERPAMEWTLHASSYFYSFGRVSLFSGQFIFDYDAVSNSMRTDEELTYHEAVLAVARVFDSISSNLSAQRKETEEDRQILAAAKAKYDQILNTESDWTLGEGGKVYYVSPNGDDRNDGLSPETAWKSLDKVNSAALEDSDIPNYFLEGDGFPEYVWAAENRDNWADLNPGDVVLFERGGLWRGMLRTKSGVTYSAYGEGPKPEIWGSPENGAGAEKWSLMPGTDNIWVFYKPLQDCGGILLGEDTVAIKKMAFWDDETRTYLDVGNGQHFSIEVLDNAPTLDVKTMEDLYFFNYIEYQNPILNSAPEYGVYGTLYLRCDAGNPGEIYNSIEFFTGNNAWNHNIAFTADYVTLDNLSFRYGSGGVQMQGYSNAKVQNCIICWMGGITLGYEIGIDGTSWVRTGASIPRTGDGIMVGGTSNVARNNYVSQTFDMGITVEEYVGASMEEEELSPRKDILVSDNLLEYCGGGVLVADWYGVEYSIDAPTFTDITIENNMVLYSAMTNWAHLEDYELGGTYMGSVILALNPGVSGIVIRNNTLYLSAEIGQLINIMTFGSDEDTFLFDGNTYVQHNNTPMISFDKRTSLGNACYSSEFVYVANKISAKEGIREYLHDKNAKAVWPSFDVKYSMAHVFNGTECTVCGEPDPDYVKPTEPKPTEPKPTEPKPTEPEPPKVEGVTRLAGENRLVTSELIADQLKEKMGVEKFENIIVASGGTFADALPGSYLAAVKNAPIILTLAKQKYIDQTAAYIKANLVEGGTVYILGGESAVPTLMETALTGIHVKRVAGADRFGTNLAILKEAGVKEGDEILVCTAKEFADSLSAAATGKPILLVYKKITDEQKDYLGTLTGNTFCVVGGTSAVPENLEEAMKAYGNVSRLAGKDRLDTSILVAQKYFPNATSSVVAYGWDFPDGLCGGSLAYATKSPLILTHSKEKLFKFTADYTVAAGLNAGYVLGGDGLVSDAAAKAIFNCNEITILK